MLTRRPLLIAAATVPLAVRAAAAAAAKAAGKAKKIRVLFWSEQTEPRDVYPTGISGQLAEALGKEKDLETKTAELSQPEAGLPDALLAETDVLVWFGHVKHKDVPDEAVDRVVRHIRERGMGFIGLHSAHFAKPLKKALEATGAWSSYKNLKQELKVWVVAPNHPIAKGVKDFTIPEEEIYTEPFEVPAPEAVVLEGSWPSGHRTRECLTWTVGKGRFVYFRMGHETYPIFKQPEMLRLVTNALRFAAGKTTAPKKLARREAGPKATAEGPIK